MQGRISAVRPVAAFAAQSGSAISARPTTTPSQSPRRSAASATVGPLDPADREHRHRVSAALQERCDLDVRGLGVVEQRDRVGHRAVDAGRDDECVRAGRHEHLRRLERVRRPDPARRDVVAVQPHDEREPRRLAADARHDLGPEAGPLGDRVAAVGVRAEVARGGEELVHEIAVAGVQLDRVEARLGGARGRGPEGRRRSPRPRRA